MARQHALVTSHWNLAGTLSARTPHAADICRQCRMLPTCCRHCQLSYMEHLYDDIFSHHDGHNKGKAIMKKLGETFSNISRDWTMLFTQTCPGCIADALKPMTVSGLRPIVTNVFTVRGQLDLIDLQSMPDGVF